MPTYERETWLDAPLDDVWAFHSAVDGLRALTPDWMHLRVERIDRPTDATTDADPASDELVAGTDIYLSVRPFGLGPRQHVVSHIATRERRSDTAYFVDTMRDGPFPEWEHTHQFFGDDERTLVRDRIRYRLPLAVPGALSNLAFEAMFRYRHRRTREILSGEEP
ncbi:SRPBCC family protein [Halospeciosus flavus]|uniref:SRPBCC family protein n=1 Tax=Halospeciosus flavus TaxID=3032283 RepID=A0ABD5Z211_9EURY|nr:SRPBCC family protein [Halospeciosus flavus]